MKLGAKAQLAFAIAIACIAFSTQCSAQFSQWRPQQINTTICVWHQPRAALVRDTVYIDGGDLWWSPGMASGEYGQPFSENAFKGNILTYNLSQSFSKDSNVTGVLLSDVLSKARGGQGNGVSSDPNYYDGGMLANDAQFFLYGGAVYKLDELYDAPAANAVLGYRRYPYGPPKPLWEKGFAAGHLDDGVTRYVAYGGAVSAPSENKAWYFSGLASSTKGPIEFNGPINGSTQARNVSNTLIELNMKEQFYEKWSNITLPDKIKGRANPEVVWVPVGKEGILVVLGGVVFPEWANETHQSEDPLASKLRSQEFMRVIDIYDVANKEWYQQATEGGPGASTRGCAVVASAPDKSSFNIYYYGGFDGINPSMDFSDEVWVLSLPSFTWTLLNKGTPEHARSGHKCFMPYPDQMMVFGGYTASTGKTLRCLSGGPVVVFNLTTGTWLDGYSPTKYGDYGVPKKMVDTIGGTSSGGATAKSPVPSGWASKALGEVFSTAYDAKKLKQYWPYSSTSSSPPSSTPSPPGEQPVTQSSDPLLSIILPAVLVPLACSIAIGVAIWYCCSSKRKRRSAALSSSDSTAVDESGLNILMWMRGQGAFKRATLTDTPQKPETSVSPDLEENLGQEQPASDKSDIVHHEMEDTQVSELCDTSSPAELHDTGFTPMNAFQNKFGYYGSEAPYSPSCLSQSNGQWGLDSMGPPSQTHSSECQWRDSPHLGAWSQSPPQLELRNLPGPEVLPREHDALPVTPDGPVAQEPMVSPLSVSERLPSDYLSAGSMMSPLARTFSVEPDEGRFHEGRHHHEG